MAVTRRLGTGLLSGTDDIRVILGTANRPLPKLLAYDRLKAFDLLIRSGAIESAICRIVNLRISGGHLLGRNKILSPC